MNFPSNESGLSTAGYNAIGRYGYNDGDYWRLYYRTGNNGNYTYYPEGDGPQANERHGTVYRATNIGNNGTITWTAYNGTRYNFTDNTTRLEATKVAVKNLVSTLLAQNAGSITDMIEISYVTFSSNAHYVIPTSASSTGWVSGTSTTALNNAIDATQAAGATNWTQALTYGENLANAKKSEGDDTYIVFFSDGAPTAGGNGYNDVADDIHDDGFNLYGIFAYGDSTDQNRMHTLVSHGNYGDGRHVDDVKGVQSFAASNQAEIEAAFAAIASAIANAVGLDDVSITDGTTSKVSASSDLSLLNVVPNSYDYYLSWQMPQGSNKITMFIDGVSKEYTVTQSGSNVVISWDGGSATYEGTIDGNAVKIKWDKATGFYDHEPPGATYNSETGAVKWDLDPVGTLLDEVTYTVTFDVYPSQTALDYRARLENGEAYNDVVPEEARDYFHPNGTLETNTAATLTYNDTRTDDGSQTVGFTNPDPVRTQDSTLTVSKEWEGEEPDTDSIELTVLMDGEVFHEVTLSENTENPDASWKASSFISVGIIKDGQALAGSEGHDFSFAELDDTQYHWELDAPTVRPMRIGQNIVMLIKVDDKHPAPSDADTYTINGATYYADSSAAGLTAVNHRRSNLNLTKEITGNKDMAPENAAFPFTLTVNNSKAPATEPTDDPEHNSDYWVWFSIYDTAENKTVYDANVTGATAETRTVDTSDSRVSDFNYDEETGLITYRWNGSETLSTLKYVSVSGTVYTGNTGYYYAPSGSEIGVDMEADWNLRFTNLPSGTTYTFAEGTMPAGFAFDKSVLTTGTDTTFQAGQTTTGTIQGTKTSYAVKFSNKYEPVDASVGLVKTVTGKDATEQFSFTLAAADDATKQAIENKTVVMPESLTATTKTEGFIKKDGSETVTFGDITFFREGTYKFTLDETTTTTAPGWTYDDSTKEVTVKVEADKETGVLTATVTGNNPTFTNSYDEVTAAPSVTKEVKGWDATEQFTFSIALKSGEAANVKMPDATTVTTKTEGNIKKDGTEKLTFNDITFYAEGTYVFTIDETTTTTAKGWTYDASTKDVTVVVSKDNNGKLVANIQNDNPTFTNSYEAAPINAKIPVTKNIVPKGSSTTDITGKFTFTLAAVTEGAPMPTPATVTSAADGVAAYFNDIEFTKPGTYEYTITESITDGSADVNGITLETGEPRSISVTVKDDGTGTLIVETNNGATFNNPYQAKSLDIVIPVKKTLEVPEGLTGPDITEGYTFTIADDPSDEVSSPLPETKTVKNPGARGGDMSFGGEATGKITVTQPGTYKYIITESGSFEGVDNDADATRGKVVTVVVTDNKNGTMSYTINDAEDTTDDTTEFVNVYDAQPVTASFPVQKVLTIPEDAEDAPADWTYTINVAGTPAADSMTGTVTKTNPTTTFGPFTYTEPGTYEYTVTESGEIAGVVNDASATTGKTVTVEVEDGKAGKLVVKSISSTTESPLQFTNTYHETGITIPVTKQLKKDPENLEGPDITNQYTFTISGSTGAPLPETKSIKNSGGAMQFGPITFNEEGTYTYTVTESGTVAGVTNDSAKTVTVTVTRGEDGELTATLGDVKSFDFINTYTVEPTTASFPVKKMISKPDDAEGPADWSYDVKVEAKNGAPVVTEMEGKVTKAEPTTTFGPFTYSAPGTYEYTVTESGTVPGVVNETGSKTVKVTVVDNKDGTLTATADSTTEKPATFTNSYSYEGTEAVLQVKKTLSVPEGLEGPDDISEKFEFTLSAVTEGAPMPAGTGNVVKNPDADGGLAKFGNISYTKPGEYTYKIVESAGNVDGVTNDTSEQTVTVKIVDGSDGKLKVDSIKYSNGKANAEFTNVYSVEKTTASFPVEKIMTIPQGLTGPADWSYDVKVAAQDGAPAAKVMEGKVTKAAPSTTFGPFEYTAPGTYKYTVSETGTVKGVTNDAQAAGKTVTVTVVDNGDGTLTATPDFTEKAPLQFTNVYSVKETTASFPVNKNLVVPEGLEGPADWSYDVKVEAKNGAPVATAMEGKVTKAAPTAEFGPFTYTVAGTYEYTVSETGTIAGVTNDAQAAGKTVKVTVVDNGDGTLTATADSTKDKPITFTNNYAAEKVTASFPVEKIMTVPEGLTGPADWSYDVKVAAQDGAPAAKVMEGKVTKAAPSTTFGPFEYTAPGTYKYTVSETGTIKGVTNDKDAAGKTVTVVVKDGKDGKLVVDSISATEKEPLTFTNTYSVENTTASFPVKKDMVVPEGLTGPAKWSYDVKVEAQDGAPEAKTMKGTVSNETDTVTFGDFTYSMPGTYKYTVSETGTIKGVTNDAQAAGKTVTVTVVDNGDGTLTATPDFNAEKPLTFTNTYSVEKTTAGFPVEKIMTVPEGLTGPADWSYAVKVAAQDGAPEAETMEGTVTKAEPSVTFDGFTYTMPGTYKYTVSEAGQVAGVANDAQAAGKTVTVTVVDNGDGTLTATPDFTEKAPLQFTNTYSVKETTASFPVKKNMVVPEELDGPESWSYEIKVEAKDGAPAAETMTGTVTDKADTVTFGEFTYTMPGTYKYTVSEAGDIAGVTNDKEAKGKEVTVTVVDNGDGTLTATADSTADAPLAFTNTYSVEKVIVDPPVKKILKDADLKDHEGEFTFKIEGKTAPEGVEEIPMPTNTEITNSKKFLKDGSTDLYEFGEIEYLVPGTYTYTVSEVGGNLDYIKYDGSEYTLTVTVTDNKDGTLSAKMDPEEGEMVFNNEYTAAGTFNIEAKKVLKGADLKDGQFTFTLEGPEGKLPETVSVKNKADGTVTFGPIAIDQNDVGKTFEYTITEVNDKQANVAYDAKKITAKVTVVDNHDGTLSVKTDYSDKATFTNKYEEPPVKTGDTTVIVPYIVIGLASIALLLMILFRRRKAN